MKTDHWCENEMQISSESKVGFYIRFA